MKKTSFILLIGVFLFSVSISYAGEVVRLEIPTSNLKKTELYPSPKSHSKIENVSASTINQTYEEKDNKKKITEKTQEETKSFTQKTVEATKSAAKKTAESTKNITEKTLEETKDFIDDISTGEITVENLEKKSSIKTLKNEKKALQSAYNSRIKDINAKIKSTQKSTVISDVEKQNKIYVYEKEIVNLEQQRDSAVKKYDAKINDLKKKK